MSDGHDHECIEIRVTRGVIGKIHHVHPMELDSLQYPEVMLWELVTFLRADVKQAYQTRREELTKARLTPGIDGATI